MFSIGNIKPLNSIVGNSIPINEINIATCCELVLIEIKIPSVRQVIIEMTSKRLGATAVLNDQGTVTGVITDGDLRRMLEKEESPANLTGKDIMSPDPRTIQKDELAVDALEMMRNNSITQVIVMENEKYIGMIHLHDLIKEGLL